MLELQEHIPKKKNRNLSMQKKITDVFSNLMRKVRKEQDKEG